jgi:hypothetical protein
MKNPLTRLERRYSPDEERPLGGYLMAMSAYAVGTTAAVVTAKAKGRSFPALSLGEFTMVALATFKVSRITAKDAVTSPLRAPFTEYVEPTGAAELKEDVVADGPAHGFGELLTCPFCLSVWVATAFTAGRVFAPNLTRAAATAFSAVAVSDALQIAYDKAKDA